MKKINKIILDANVLYPAPLRDFLLNLALLDLYVPGWTDKIQEEWSSNLLKNRTDLKRSQLNRTIRLMNETFPNANITNYASLEKDLKLPDPDDRHVLAAAIKSKSNLIVTNNLKDFPSSTLAKYNIDSISADHFILSLIKSNKPLVLKGFSNQLQSLRNPKKTREELL